MRGEGTAARCGGRRVRRERSEGPSPCEPGVPGAGTARSGRGARAEPAPPGKSGGEERGFPAASPERSRSPASSPQRRTPEGRAPPPPPLQSGSSSAAGAQSTVGRRREAGRPVGCRGNGRRCRRSGSGPGGQRAGGRQYGPGTAAALGETAGRGAGGAGAPLPSGAAPRYIPVVACPLSSEQRLPRPFLCLSKTCRFAPATEYGKRQLPARPVRSETAGWRATALDHNNPLEKQTSQ